MADQTVREALAAYAHDAWSGWMRYMLSKAPLNADGTWTMPAWAVERWTRQMTTAYTELPEEERASDRKEADQMLAIVASPLTDSQGRTWHVLERDEGSIAIYYTRGNQDMQFVVYDTLNTARRNIPQLARDIVRAAADLVCSEGWAAETNEATNLEHALERAGFTQPNPANKVQL